MAKLPISGPGSRPNPFLRAKAAVQELRDKRDQNRVTLDADTASWLRHQVYFDAEDTPSGNADKQQLTTLADALARAQVQAVAEDDEVIITLIVRKG